MDWQDVSFRSLHPGAAPVVVAMASDPDKARRKPSRRDMWEHAVFRWESAVVIALTILGTSASIVFSARGAIPGWSWLACLMLGIGGEAVLIYASLQESTTHRMSNDTLRRGRSLAGRTDRQDAPADMLPSADQRHGNKTKEKRPLFLSYAEKDIQVAERVCRFLEERGQPCWYAKRDERAGHHWGAEIVDAIEKSSGLVLVLSTTANDSEHVKNEVHMAASFGQPRYPVLIEQVKPRPEILLHITAFHWVEAWNGRLEDHLERLLAGIKARDH